MDQATKLRMIKRLIKLVKQLNKGEIDELDYMDGLDELEKRYEVPRAEFNLIVTIVEVDYKEFKPPQKPLGLIKEETPEDMEGMGRRKRKY